MATAPRSRSSKGRPRAESRPDAPASGAARPGLGSCGESVRWASLGSTGRAGVQPIPEIETYVSHLGDLLKAEGKFVLIKGSEVVGIYESEEDADADAARRFGAEPVMIKRIVSSDPAVSLGGILA